MTTPSNCLYRLKDIFFAFPNPFAVNKSHNLPLPTLPRRVFRNNKYTSRNSARTCFLTIKTGRQAFAGTRPSFATISFNRLYT